MGTIAVVDRTNYTALVDDDGTNTTGTVATKEAILRDAVLDPLDALIAKVYALSICDGRLTLTTGVPVTTADVTGATTLRFAPYSGNRIALYDGSTYWNVRTFAELSIAVPSVVAQAYDAFIYDNSGTATLELLEWANATVTITIASPGVVTWTAHGMSTGQAITFTTTGALPTGLTANTQYWITVVDANTFKLSTSPANVAAGTFIATSGTQSGTHTGHQPQARATALTTQDGVLVKTGATTRRYVGTILTTGTSGQTEDSATKRYVWNYYNRVRRFLKLYESTNTWNYTTAAYRQANASAANQVDVVVGVAETLIDLTLNAAVDSNQAAGTIIASISIGEDSTSAATQNVALAHNVGINMIVQLSMRFSKYPAVGRHFYAWLEQSTATGTTRWYGQSSQGITGSIEG